MIDMTKIKVTSIPTDWNKSIHLNSLKDLEYLCFTYSLPLFYIVNFVESRLGLIGEKSKGTFYFTLKDNFVISFTEKNKEAN